MSDRLLRHVGLGGGQRRLRPQELCGVLVERGGVVAHLRLEHAEVTAEHGELGRHRPCLLPRDAERGLGPAELVVGPDLVRDQPAQCGGQQGTRHQGHGPARPARHPVVRAWLDREGPAVRLEQAPHPGRPGASSRAICAPPRHVSS